MERFLNIDWNPPLEDILNSTFIHEERLEKESVTHRIMTGNFSDPFKDIEDDYKNVKTHLMEGIESEASEEDEDDNIETTEVKTNIQPSKKQVVKNYVPGITKPICRFPRPSNLNKEQHAMCLRVLLRFSESDKPKITQTEREELKKYMDLQKIISQEQDEYLALAKSTWNQRSLAVVCENYINLCWKLKLQYVHRLPRYYAEVTNIPFVADKNIEVKFVSVCLQMGQLPKVVLPTFRGPYKLYVNSKQLEERFPLKYHTPNEPFKLPVSEDRNCQTLAENHDVDLVISSSGLNCLVNNIGPNYSNSWMLPVVIKKHNDKNVIYIDKRAPPTASTIPEKNTWVYKYILKYFFIPRKQHIPERNSTQRCNSDNTFDDFNYEELLKLEEQEDASICGNNESHSTTLDQNDSTDKISEQQDLKDDTDSPENVTAKSKEFSHTISDCNISDSTISTEAGNTSNVSINIDSENENSELSTADNVSYKLFTMGSQSSEQSELMKNVIKEYKILVRTKTDGYETLQKNLQRLLLLAPKLEHQIDLGAEAVTLEEALKQWISLIFRPLTFLARVRIATTTPEVLQVEYRTAMSISNEIKRLYNVRVEDSLTVLHNVIQCLSDLSPGRYIVRHTVRNGAFATVYKEAETAGKNIFDIHTVYGKQFHSSNSSWIPLDKMIPTPMQKCFERMPAMYYPSNYQKFSKNKRSMKMKMSNTETIRRSLRNKKKK